MKQLLPALLRQLSRGRLPIESLQLKEYFTQVYLRNSWGSRVSRSGPGSEGALGRQKNRVMVEIIADFGISSILDIGCGDLHWMKDSIPGTCSYHGVDIVGPLIRANQEQFAQSGFCFQCLDLTDPLDQKLLSMRRMDLVVCLDVLGHLLNHEVESLLRFMFHDIDAKFVLLINRRAAGSSDYLQRPKTRTQGIDIEQHRVFIERNPKRVKEFAALYRNDFFDLYDLARKD